MARLKENDDNWHASSIQRRDAQHDASTPEVGPHRAKKNRKKWCGGKPGKTHDLIYQLSHYYNKSHFRRAKEPPVMEVACGRCNKYFETDHGWFSLKPPIGKDAMLAKWRRKLYGTKG